MYITKIISTLLYYGYICIPSEHKRRNDLTSFINIPRVNCANLIPTVAQLLRPGAIASFQLLILRGKQVTSKDYSR
jgi:hypothetical protein